MSPSLHQLGVLGLISIVVSLGDLPTAVADTPEPAEEPAAQPIPDLVFARMVENPVSGITRLPVANATTFGIPPDKRVANAFVLAPVLPVLFNGGWSIITRTTIPAVVTVPFASDAVPPWTGRTTGFGEISLEVLGHKMLRGKKGQFYDIALGPFVGFPSASDELLGSGRWRLGPELVLALSAKQWVTILATRNVWSVDQPGFNRLFLEYFLFYNLPKLFYLLYETTFSANWDNERGNQWTVPIGIGFGRHHRIPKRPRLAITTRISGLYNAVQTSTDGDWQLIATLVFWKPNPAVFDFD